VHYNGRIYNAVSNENDEQLLCTHPIIFAFFLGHKTIILVHVLHLPKIISWNFALEPVI
jgi:hypothetical protein